MSDLVAYIVERLSTKREVVMKTREITTAVIDPAARAERCLRWSEIAGDNRAGRFMHVIVDPVRQADAIPVRAGRVCLVMSSNRKRWVIPKGCIEPGQSA